MFNLLKLVQIHMTLTQRVFGKILKVFGVDPTESRWYNAEWKEFEIQTPDKTVTVEGHDYVRHGDSITVYEITDEGWALATFSSFAGDMAVKAISGSDGFSDVAHFEKAIVLSENEIGETNWNITLDISTSEITNVEREEIRV